MLIGIDASRANRSHKSGTEWYSYYLIKKLAEIDDRNQYVLYTDEPLRDGLLDLSSKDPGYRRDDCELVGGCQKLISPHNNFKAKILRWPLKFFWTHGRLSWEMLLRPPDILFVPAHSLPLWHPRRSVVTIHDIGYKQEQSLYSREQIGYKTRLWDWLILIFTFGRHRATSVDYLDWSTGFTLRKAKQVITISNFSKEEIIKHYRVTANKIKVIYNGYNTDLFKREQNEKILAQVLDIYGLEPPFIFYVGRLEKKKNIAALVEAYALARHRYNLRHKLYLIGDASFGYDEVKYLINEFSVEGEVLTTGWVEEEHLPHIYNAAAAFIFPTKYEGFGIPLLQAMASGTPIAASRVAAVPEIVGEAALFFNPDDIGEMAKVMANVAQDKTTAERLRQLGLTRVKLFSWDKCARETLSVLENL